MRTMKKARETSPTARKVAKDIFTIPNLISVAGAALAIHGSEKSIRLKDWRNARSGD